VILLVAEIEDRPVAAWPFLLWRCGPLRFLGSPLPATGTVYLGPLIRPEVEVPPVLRAFLAHGSLQRYTYLGCRVLDRSRAVDLEPFGFARTRSFDTYCIDLRRTEKQLWDGLRSECRSRIRKALKLGVEIQREESLDFLDDFWSMTRETFRRTHGRPTHSRKLVTELWKRLWPQGRLEVLSARFEGKRIATLVLPFDASAMYYWAGASFDRHRAVPAGNLLHWEAIRGALRRGLCSYDLDSIAGSPGRFKRSFGAEVVRTATHWEHIPSRMLTSVKRLLERAVRRLAKGNQGQK
jgi:predicted N-acyltransferase